jgi:hypothetical protein
MLTATVFLTTRVTKATEEDMSKLERLLKYLRGTRDLGLVLDGREGLGVLAWADASYAVHPDAKGHNGTIVRVGKCLVYAQSSKQKVVSRSSTESELIALHEAIPQVLWIRRFMLAQGYKIGATTVYQDNLSTMALAAKGKSTSVKTKHIAVRCFFVKSVVDAGEISLEHMPTANMLADMMTKPLQGELLRTGRKEVLGCFLCICDYAL